MSNLQMVINKKKAESAASYNFFILGFSVGFAAGCLFFAVVMFI
jgi:hypothetical protein